VSDGNITENLREALAAALRELEEELGVPGDRVECLERLPEQQRRRDELIVPFVGWLAEDVELNPDGIVVEEVFTLSLDRLLQNDFKEAGLTEQYNLPDGRWNRKVIRSVRYLIYGKYLIWGLSANILFQLLELIR